MANSRVISFRVDSLDQVFLDEIHSLVLERSGIDATPTIILKTALKYYRDWLSADPSRAE